MLSKGILRVVYLQVLCLTVTVNAGFYPEKIQLLLNSKTDLQHSKILRQVLPGQGSSVLNRFQSHGLALSSHVGFGVTVKEGTSNIFDRYFSTNFTIGNKVHFANDNVNHNHDGTPPNISVVLSAISTISTPTAVTIPTSIRKTTMTPLTTEKIRPNGFLESGNETSRHNLWKRINTYFSRSKIA